MEVKHNSSFMSLTCPLLSLCSIPTEEKKALYIIFDEHSSYLSLMTRRVVATCLTFADIGTFLQVIIDTHLAVSYSCYIVCLSVLGDKPSRALLGSLPA
jgi:hypothetical protein